MVEEVAFSHSFVQFHGFSRIDASERDHADVAAFFHASEKRIAVVPVGSDVVFLTAEHARFVDDGQETVLVYDALHTVLISVEGAVDIDSGSGVGQAAFGDDLSVATFVPVFADVHLFSVIVAARARTTSAALRVGQNVAGQSRNQKRAEKRCIEFHHFQ